MSDLPSGMGKDSADFRRLNPHLFPVAPAFTSKAVAVEADLHDEIEKHCTANGFLIVHARRDVPSTIAVGHPDFTICMPERKTVFIECKARGKKTTTEQNAKLAHARKLGYVAEVVDNMGDALEAMRKAREDSRFWT